MNRPIVLSGLLALSLLGFTSCDTTAPYATNNENLTVTANENDNSNDGLANTNVTNTNTNSLVAENDAEEFLKAAAYGGTSAIKLSELASSKATNADVKAFAKMVVQDHGKLNGQLKKLAEKAKFTLPKDMNEDQQEAYDELAKLSGAEFDNKYVALMLEAHDDAVEAFEDAAEDTENADLQAFAKENLPKIKAHAEKIKAISEKISR